MTIHYTGQRHRGCCAATETPALRRKYAKRGMRMSARAYHRGMEALARAEREAEFLAFQASLGEVVEIHPAGFEQILAVYRKCHPKGRVAA